jgi:hypothetical protein
MRVTERLGSLFIDESLRDREVLADGTTEFIATQLDEAQRKLVENENKVLEYQRLHDGELPSQTPANLQAQHNAEMALQSLGEALNRDRERRITLERSSAISWRRRTRGRPPRVTRRGRQQSPTSKASSSSRSRRSSRSS